MSITDRLSLTRDAELEQLERDDDTIRVRKLKAGGVKIEIVRGGKTVIRTVLATTRAVIGQTIGEHFAL